MANATQVPAVTSTTISRAFGVDGPEASIDMTSAPDSPAAAPARKAKASAKAKAPPRKRLPPRPSAARAKKAKAPKAPGKVVPPDSPSPSLVSVVLDSPTPVSVTGAPAASVEPSKPVVVGASKRREIGVGLTGLRVILVDIEVVRDTASRKRDVLLRTGRRSVERKKLLTVVSGVLALLSAGAIAAVLTTYAGEKVTQVFAAFCAFVSGVIALANNAYHSDEESLATLTGAQKYMEIRDAAQRVLRRPEQTAEEAFAQLEVLQRDHQKVDVDYSRFIPLTTKKLPAGDEFSASKSPVELVRR